MRTGFKKVFFDPSIAVAALNLSPESFNTPDGLETFGFIFENLCIRDLNVYTSSLNGQIRYYHDDTGIEIDCVVHLRDDRYALIECKLGKTNIEKGAQNLLKVSKLIEKKMIK
jgi:predicted AAA+ superfamily ATPase